MFDASQAGRGSNLKFGTFAGVFTPSILTIFGVIMFMRANYVVGQAGIINAVAILLLCQFITLLTTLSVGAIATNMPIKGGGAYFMVSRVLGAEFGGAIGITLFLAQVVSISFYLLGFAEAATKSFKFLEPYFLYTGLAAATVLFLIARVGADWAIRTQYVIMAILFSSIFVYLAGASRSFSSEQFATNLYSANCPMGGSNFWALFAIYFPSVTGFIAGINMSGDLETPGESMVKGTLYALLVATTVYFLQIIFFGGGFARAELINTPYKVMLNNALFGAEFMVIAGVYAATLSSALGRFVGAPRVLQAIARDEIIPFLKPFARGYGENDEPRAALYFCGVSTLILLWLGGDGSGGVFLNHVAAVMGMFFLFTFGLLNLAAFIEAYSANPSFRPRFKFFHWSLALLGFIGSFGSAMLIDYQTASIALFILFALVFYLRKRKLAISFGDARRGFLYSRIRDNLFILKQFEDDIRNWRPSIITLSGNPSSRETLVTYSVWLNAGRGLVILANILIGKLADLNRQRLFACEQLNGFLDEKNIQAFSQVVVADDVPAGVRTILQGSAYGPLRPNLFICGWMGDSRDPVKYASYLREATYLNVSQILVCDRGLPDPQKSKRIDIWWRGQKNGPLMILMAHLLSHNWEWGNSRIVLKRVIQNEDGLEQSKKALEELIDFARVDAEPEVVVCGGNFADTLHKSSGDADCVFIGFELPESGREEDWFDNYEKLLQGLPTALLVHSTDARDYLAHD
ncbi:MAG: amino acid permease [Candidatus Riflebacteria bacterium HGW-Riflebacteria-1]|jgi:amino acid transporter|nr:MAG: amino acid permease [Candidatus Riflebacteria bacterium HGW-Riflebacteria-1]